MPRMGIVASDYGQTYLDFGDESNSWVFSKTPREITVSSDDFIRDTRRVVSRPRPSIDLEYDVVQYNRNKHMFEGRFKEKLIRILGIR
jgi:hypothetical protein